MVREADADDYKEIHALCENELGYACDSTLVKKKLSNVDTTREVVFVATIEGKVVGFIHAEKYELLYAAGMANILGIAVQKDCRRRGIGRALLVTAEEWAKSRGIGTMRLNSGASRTEAHTFYRNNGYCNEKQQVCVGGGYAYGTNHQGDGREIPCAVTRIG